MIRLTRINGSEFSLNPDLIHRAEETPDTVLTLIDGSRYVVVQRLDELIDRIVGYRARVVAEAGRMAEHVDTDPGRPHDHDRYDHDGRDHDGRDHDRRDHERADGDEHTDGDDDHEGADVVRLRTRRA